MKPKTLRTLAGRTVVPMTLAVILILTTLFAAACSPKTVELSDAEAQEKAERLIDLLSDTNDKSGEAVKMFSSQMAKSLPADSVRQLWPDLMSELGEYRGRGDVSLTEEAGYKSVHIICSFSKSDMNCRVVFDRSGDVAGLWFLPAEPSASLYSPPQYAHADSFTEIPVTVGSENWPLPGILTLPKGEGPFPAVILVHGSGPNDMDETIGENKPFKDLAWGLASKGVAVLRYEKRTKAHLAQMTELMASITVEQETVEDAVLAAALLKTQDGIDPQRIFVLGHSLGGMLAPRIAAFVPEHSAEPAGFAGIIMMAANARSLPDLMEEQVDYLISAEGGISAQEATSIKEACDKIRDGRLDADEVVLGASSIYWEDLMGYDQVAAASELELPILILQGERDYQVTMTDFGLWKEAFEGKQNAVFKSYPSLNHLFIKGVGNSLPAEYQVPGNVHEQAVDDIAEWIKLQ